MSSVTPMAGGENDASTDWRIALNEACATVNNTQWSSNPRIDSTITSAADKIFSFLEDKEGFKQNFGNPTCEDPQLERSAVEMAGLLRTQAFQGTQWSPLHHAISRLYNFMLSFFAKGAVGSSAEQLVTQVAINQTQLNTFLTEIQGEIPDLNDRSRDQATNLLEYQALQHSMNFIDGVLQNNSLSDENQALYDSIKSDMNAFLQQIRPEQETDPSIRTSEFKGVNPMKGQPQVENLQEKKL